MKKEINRDYWDYQLPFFLKYYFPLDFPTEFEKKLQPTYTSHASAVNFPEHVTHYLHTEIGHEAIHGPYKDSPYGKILMSLLL